MSDEHKNEFDLTGRIILVTGGSRGMGREMVRAFARHGADVIIVSRKLEGCEEAAEEVRKQYGRKAWAYACHVGDWSQIDALVERIYSEVGRVDVLVNNAGMSPLYESLEAITEDLYDKVMGVNLKGPFRLSTLIGARMVRGDGGAMIHVSSCGAVTPSANELPYSNAKAGLHNLSTGLARSLGPKVRSNVIMPGPFLTDISKAWDMKAMQEHADKEIPLRRMAEPDEIVGAALLLASNASSYISGAVIKVDGGLLYAAS
jgi:NAD(P)-dependent dehydrogenase (short-subunit alcohol dehydrogenase family)